MAFIGGGFGFRPSVTVGDAFFTGGFNVQGSATGFSPPDFGFLLGSNAALFNGWNAFGGSFAPIPMPGPFERIGPSLSGVFNHPTGTGGFFLQSAGNPGVTVPGPPSSGGGGFPGFQFGAFGGGGYGGGGFGGGGFGALPGLPPHLGQFDPAFGGLPGLAPHLGQPDPAFGGLPGLPPHLGQFDPAFGGLPGLPPHLGQYDQAFGGLGFGGALPFPGFGGPFGFEGTHPFFSFGLDVGLQLFPLR